MTGSSPRDRGRFCSLLLAVLCLGAVLATAVPATAVPATAVPATGDSGPGALELAGSWRLRDGDGGTWVGVSLPAGGSTLGAARGGGSLELERELQLDGGWRRRLAPSGLAILISGAGFGRHELRAGENLVASWTDPMPGIAEPAVRVFAVPDEAVDGEGRLHLSIRWQWSGWSPARLLRRRAQIGEAWLLGDQQRLQVEAERRRLHHLNGDLPLLIMALLYAAVGAYHLQLFRRDRRCREYLWFGATAIIVAVHTLLFTHLATLLCTSYPAAQRLHLMTGAVMIATSIQFLWPFLSRPIGRMLRAYQRSFVVIACLIAVLPELPFSAVLARAWGIPFLPAVAILLTRELRRGNAEARTIAAGGFSIIAVSGAELVFLAIGRGTIFPLQVYAFAVFAGSMAFSLSNRFSRVHDELDVLRQQLEGMVEDQAAELSSANEKLRSEISERELAQEAMHMLERAVEQSIDGILVADLERNTLFINEAWAHLHGHETFEVFGRRLDLFHSREQMRSEVGPALDRVRQEGSWEGEIGHLRNDGASFPTWTSVTLLRDPDGEPMGFVMVARDITERQRGAEEKQRVEARIQEAEKLRSLADLAGGIAHDYNNLLTGVLGHSSLTLRQLPPDSLARDKLAQIGNAAERAADLTAQLLAYAGVETLVLERTDLDQMITGSRAELEQCAGAEARLEIELDGDLPSVEIDTTQVHQAVVNLIAYAADAVPRAGGAITLETGTVHADSAYLADTVPDADHPPGDYVFVRVSVSSEIDEEHRGRLFDPFSSTRRSAQGLGMATVLSTARDHRGTIKVASRTGGGSSFELLFPAASEEVVEAVDAAPGLGKWRGSGTVLVVDDEYIMREVSRSILEQWGFEVLATGEGQEALELYRRHMLAIRLVLLDRTMPTMPGEEVVRRILALNPEARILLMSGYKSDSVVDELIDQGMADFLPKPFRPEELVDKVRRVLG